MKKTSLVQLPLDSRGRFLALKLAVIYAVFGALWIFLSDHLLFYAAPDLQLAERLQNYKGWFFVASTSVLLWFLAKRFLTQVRAAEEALHRSNRKLQAISDCNQLLLRATDEQSLLEEVCRLICEEAGYRLAWVGYAGDDMAKGVRPVAWSGTEGGYPADLVTWADTEPEIGPSRTAIRSGKTCCSQNFATEPQLAAWGQSVLRHGCRSGSALPLKDEQGKAFGCLTIYSAQPNAFTPEEIGLLEELAADLAFGIVTLRSGAARKRAEQALHESEASFRTFVDHAADAFFMLDFERASVLDVNRTACESLGYTREELIGRTPQTFDTNLDPSTLNSFAERTATGETASFSRQLHRRKDGSLFPVEVHTSLFWNGGRRYLLMVARDITDRIRAEEERERLRQVEAHLAHINRVNVVGELAASIAHEVNQPLSGIVSNADACLRWLSADQPQVEEVREAVSDIIRDGRRAGEVLARIRALTKRIEPAKEKVDLNEIIREVFAIVGDEAKKSGVTMRTESVDDLSPVYGDRVQLQQVVLNLVINAIQAMSGVDEHLRQLLVTTRNADPDQVEVTIKDSGPGLDPKALPRIFEPFYTTKAGGMGMGLSISRSILQSHGGRLWATANDGPGASLHFTVTRFGSETRGLLSAGDSARESDEGT